VGEVTGIKVFVYHEKLEFKVPVTIEIDRQQFHDIWTDGVDDTSPPLQDLIAKGMRARLSLQSLVTGKLMIQLDMLPSTKAVLKGDGSKPEIPTIPSNIERMVSALDELNLEQVAESINHAMRAIGDMIERGEFETVVQDIRSAAEEITSLAVTIRNRSDELTAEVQDTAKKARALMHSLNRQVNPVAGEAVRSMAQIRKTLTRADKALNTFDRLAADYAGDSAFRYELATALDEIAATARSLRALTELLQQQPDALLRGKPAPGGY